jgi:hypothetical protein
MSTTHAIRADIVAGWVTGIGIGFAVFMLTWIVANRLTALWMSAPTGPVVAIVTAILAGTVVAARQGRHLSQRFRPD